MSRLPTLLITLFLLCACGSGDNGRLNPDPETDTGALFPAQPAAQYAHSLTDCAHLYNREGDNHYNFCTLERLPLLGQDAATLTPEDVMARTLVSHDWMAQRFKQALETMPDDLLQMFQGVTGVVIGADIRPSYYWLATGAIYLDPSRLWLELEERDTISRAPDYRSDFAQALSVDTHWRYVKDGTYAWRTQSLSGPGQPRTVEQIIAPMASLLFHELAHANDYIPPSEWAHLDPALTVSEAAVQAQPASVSAELSSFSPLGSELMMDLAEVMYQGRAASISEEQLNAEQVSLEFSADTASDPYGYVNGGNRELFLEDTAMLFEEALMHHHFGVARELAFTNRPTNANPRCDDYRISWGQRGRIGVPALQSRLAHILPMLLDTDRVQPYLDSLPEPQLMNAGQSWCAHLNLSPTTVNGEPGYLYERELTQPLGENRLRFEGHPHH